MLVPLLWLAVSCLFSYCLLLRSERNDWRKLADRYRADFIKLANETYPPKTEEVCPVCDHNHDPLQTEHPDMESVQDDETFEEVENNVVEFRRTPRGGDNF